MAVGEDVSQGEGPEASQETRRIAIETPLGQDTMLLTALDGVETLSRGFVYTIEMFTRAPDADVRTLLGQPVTLWIKYGPEDDKRPLHGHVRNLRLLNTDRRGYRRWRAEVAPWFWFLSQSVDCRIYQNLDIPDIVRAVLDEYGVSYYEFRLHDRYNKLDYCVRYRESALAFVSRLLEHAGIYYFFEHHKDRHVMVLADHNGMSAFTEPRQAVIWPRHSMLPLRPDIAEVHELEHEFDFHTGQWALKDFDFEMPSKELHSREATTVQNQFMTRFETFDYPGGYTATDDGGRLTRVRMEAEEARHYRIHGSGSCAGFDPGRRFMLLPARSTGQDKPIQYFLTEVRHTARDLSYFTTSEEPPAYSNRFVCIPAGTPFRPERTTQKPLVPGPQTGTVTGPSGENIHTDQYGRVKVRFHWDRQGKRDDTSSCWVRVSQHSAGSHWGALAIPHVGQEVAIGFLEGDPDRPMVLGHVHNGANMPPLNLPGDRNKTVMRDHGDNKIVMHGKPGQQWLSAVSPRAVNLVAMRSTAKPLSADINISGVDFDQYHDSRGYGDLYNLWQELEGKAPPPTKAPGPYVADPSGADAAYQADVNLLAENLINSMSGGNTNNWVGGDMNTWVADGVHNYVTNLQTDRYGAHQEFTVGFHSEETTLHAEITVMHVEATGLHLEDTGIHIEGHTGIHVQMEVGGRYHVGDMADIHQDNQNIEFFNKHIKVVNDHIQAIDTQLSTFVDKTEIAATVSHIHQTLSYLTAEIHSILAAQFTVTAGIIDMKGAAVSVKGLAVNIKGLLVNVG
jgi:type VI secretion system secreted protein VgrG